MVGTSEIMKSSADTELGNSLKSAVRVVGKHIYSNMYDISPSYLTDAEFLESVIKGAAKVGNMHILDILVRKFDVQGSKDNGGVSIIALIEESHLTIHTWPESNFATVDIYSCGDTSNPEISFLYVLDALKPKSFEKFYANRSN